MFVGMHGKFSLGGLSNEENPLVFVDLDDNSFFHFISNDESGVGHLDGLLSTSDSLFVADISPDGGFGSGSRNEGKIYQLKSLVVALIGDFNESDAYEPEDIDLLFAQLGQSVPPADAKFDLDGNGSVGESDVDDLVLTHIGTSYGDADLDGSVLASEDGGALIANLGGGGGKGWADGDFTGDGEVTASADGALLLAGLAGDNGNAVVPEPQSAALAGLAFVAAWVLSRRRHS